MAKLSEQAERYQGRVKGIFLAIACHISRYGGSYEKSSQAGHRIDS
jgi:hypothetical protein